MGAEGGGVAEERGAALAGVGAHQTTIEEFTEGGGMTATAAAPGKTTKGQTTRKYMVLKKTTAKTSETGGMTGEVAPAAVTFELVGEYEAHGDKPAIKAACEEHGYGTYVAVAVSGWHQHTRRSERVERVRWS